MAEFLTYLRTTQSVEKNSDQRRTYMFKYTFIFDLNNGLDIFLAYHKKIPTHLLCFLCLNLYVPDTI